MLDHMMRYLKCWEEAVLMLRSGSVLAPFIIFAAIQFLMLVSLGVFSVAPLSVVMVPIVQFLGGERALHYPTHLVMLPRLYQELYLPVAIVVGFALFTWGVSLMVDHYVRSGETVPRSGHRRFRELIPSAMVVGFVFVAVVTVIQLVSSQVSTGLANPWAGRVVSLVGWVLVILFQALTIYSLYFLVIRTRNPISAIAQSVRFGRSKLPLTSSLVLTVFVLHLPVNYLTQRSDRVVLKFNPELVFVLLAVGIVIEIFTNYFLFASTTSLAAGVKREGI
jgi:hypothetical protein